MKTIIGSGLSALPRSDEAAAQAVGQARERFNGHSPGFGFLFAGPDHDLVRALEGARRVAGEASFVACTTAGEFTEKGLRHGSVAALLVSDRDTTHLTRYSEGMTEDSDAVAAELGSGFENTKNVAFELGRLRSTTILLTDGLAGTGERMMGVLRESIGPFQQIAGGAAGDEGRFEETRVGAGDRAARDASAAVHVFTRKPWGIGVGHGLHPASDRMLVTRAAGNVVYEIDGRPAFEAYREHAAKRGIELSSATAGPYMIENELGVYTFDRISKARAPLAVGADGSLTCAADLIEGASICILDGRPQSMVAAAREAAEEARKHLGGERAAGVLVFDCVCRGMILDGSFQDEIDAVRSVFGNVPVGGFLTYGEIARYRGQLGGWHNTTAVVVAIPE